jgi:hypothetical protein
LATRSSLNRVPELSVVIPAYNAATWLPSTLDALALALQRGAIRAEIVIVDDGSVDATPEVIASIRARVPFPIRVIRQDNSGRFLARWNGANAAKAEIIMLLDSRVLVGPEALAHVWKTMEHDPTVTTWNAHAITDPSAPLVGLFWEVPTRVFWGRYLRRPAPTLITPQNFDTVPKGTTAFVLPRAAFLTACKAIWPSADARLISDDTKLLRTLAESAPIRLDPSFDVLYRPRSGLGAFLGHAFARGSLFVDGYAGTSILRNAALFGLVILPALWLLLVGVLSMLGAGYTVLGLLAVAIVLGLTPVVIAAANGASNRAIASYATLAVPFAVVFIVGVARGILVHRSSFRRSGATS